MTILCDEHQRTNLLNMSEPFTLDPPGSIAVVGAGWLGIETALYGRYLGYDVKVLEAESVGHSYIAVEDQPLERPDQSLSPLAFSALQAQYPELTQQALPMTVGQWRERLLLPLSETDLLRGRVTCGAKVTSIHHAQPEESEVEAESHDNDAEAVPPDFQLEFDSTSLVCEAVVLACDPSGIDLGFQLPAAYFHAIDFAQSDDIWLLKQIVQIYAGFAGRADLDLYLPRRT